MKEDVSIHTPWEGCDITQAQEGAFEPCFNSHTLGRVRRRGSVFATDSVTVSIHTPWEGCDRWGACR